MPKHEQMSFYEIRERFPFLSDFRFHRTAGEVDEALEQEPGRNKPARRDDDGVVRVAILGKMTDGTYVVPLVMSGWAVDCVKFPGGKVEPGETIEQAAVRETLEETGVRLEKGDLIPLGENLRDVKGYKVNFFVARIDASQFVTTLKQTGDEGEIVALTQYYRFSDPEFLYGPLSLENPPLFFDHRKLADLLRENIEDSEAEMAEAT